MYRSAPLRFARLTLAAGALAALAAPSAQAQNPAAPEFKFDKPEEKVTPWQAQAKGGLVSTGGNSQTLGGTFSLTGSRRDGDNRVSLDGSLAYGRSQILVPTLDMAGDVVGFDRRGETTTNEWRTRGRYDRFFTTNNSGYLLGQIGGDRIAGKSLIAGGQVGYSRQLLKDAQHTLVAELGYDLSHERYIQSPGKSVDPVTIHSARVFVGELWALTADTGITAGVEALFNLNEENALDADDPTGATKRVKAFKDTRVLGKVGLTTTLRANLSVGLGFTVRYDQNPAPRPIPSSAKGAKYAPNFQAFADEVDTLTEATLIFTFL